MALAASVVLLALSGLGLGQPGAAALGLIGAVLAPFAAARRAGFSLRKFLFPDAASLLLVVDPETLAPIDKAVPQERLAFARMALYPGADGGEWLVAPGETFIHRWHYREGRLNYSPEWAERYRRHGEGTFSGTGPCAYDGQVYYTDNTFPVGLGKGYRLFRKPLEAGVPQQCIQLSPDRPGYQVYCNGVAPQIRAVLVTDTGNGRVEARSLGDLALIWKADVIHTDCVITAAIHEQTHGGQVYVTDHSRNLEPAQMLKSMGRRPAWPDIEKFFVVLDAATGTERLRVSLGKASPVASMIIPGMNGDVFAASRDALHRIHVAGSEPVPR